LINLPDKYGKDKQVICYFLYYNHTKYYV